MKKYDQDIRVRFAPSPTGHLHIGGLRTAIFNWLFARHNKGKFLLRIEDTDIERSKKEYFDSILETFKWMAMESDEPIVIQSERFKDHKELVDKLISEGKAYRCFCTKKADSEIVESNFKYDETCRNKNVTEEDLKKNFAVRFKLPKELTAITFNDAIHGDITFTLDQFDDFIIVRSDGIPTYNFVVVADDIYMKITHIIRGEEHINNTPKQILIYNALDAQTPIFAHVPSILNESGQKLSKRDAAVSVLEYKKEGFLADALFNYLVRLSWSHGDQEIFTKEELIQYFSLDNVGKKGAVFDLQKLEWVNTVYIRQKNDDEILYLIEHDVDKEFLQKVSYFNKEQILSLISLYKERVKKLKEFTEIIIALDKVPQSYDEVGLSQFVKPETITYLEKLVDELTKIDQWTENVISSDIKQLCKQLNIKMADITQAVRLALTGTISSPGVFSLLTILLKDESLKRLNIFIHFLKERGA